MFDAMDGQIFALIQFPAVISLIGSTNTGQVAAIGGIVLGVKIFAWGIGGIVFGVVAGRVGRAKTMIVTVLIYSVFTGLSGLAQTWGQLALLQALAGVGVRGEWAAGAALVAETWPQEARSRAMQVMQLCFGLGIFAAAALNLVIGPYGWRWEFVAGAAPAPLMLQIRVFVREPDRWVAVLRLRQAAMHEGARDSRLATLRAVFRTGARRRTVVGVLIAMTLLIGGNTVISLLPTWVHQLLPPAQQAVAGSTTSKVFMLLSAGGLVGYVGVIGITELLTRRWAYAVIGLKSASVVLCMFTRVSTIAELLWFVPVCGLFTFGGLGFFAAYFPELFPTAIRATGQGFCWNMARALAAIGPVGYGALVEVLDSVPASGRLVACVYVVGIVAI
jgi:MFS family permease